MFRRNAIMVLVIMALACLLAACAGGQEESTATLDKAERDSVLSETTLPGASAVKGALAVSDSAQARADRAAAATGK